jgi:hypothetical protein
LVSISAKYSISEYFDDFFYFIKIFTSWIFYTSSKKSNNEYFADITMTDTYNNERLKRIKKENINVIKGKIHLDEEASITNMIMNPNEEWLARKKIHHLT